jgi:hypothetical protein
LNNIADVRAITPSWRGAIGRAAVISSVAVAEVFLFGFRTHVHEREHEYPAFSIRAFLRFLSPRHDSSGHDTVDGRNEPITAPMERFNKSGILCRIPKRSAQPLDRGVEAVLEVDERAIRPQAVTNFVARDDFSWLIQHQHQNLERLVLQPHPNALLAELSRLEIYLEDAESNRPHPF